MDSELLTWLFLGGGLMLMILEMVVPGGVAFMLGFSGLGVGILRLLGFLGDPITAVTAWLVLSVVLSIAIRPFVKKYLKPETSYKFADEDYEAMDQIAVVTEPLSDTTNSGRIRFDGISWQARSLDGPVEVGSEVKIRFRENTTWIVEKIDQIEANNNNAIKN